MVFPPSDNKNSKTHLTSTYYDEDTLIIVPFSDQGSPGSTGITQGQTESTSQSPDSNPGLVLALLSVCITTNNGFAAASTPRWPGRVG